MAFEMKTYRNARGEEFKAAHYDPNTGATMNADGYIIHRPRGFFLVGSIEQAEAERAALQDAHADAREMMARFDPSPRKASQFARQFSTGWPPHLVTAPALLGTFANAAQARPVAHLTVG
jgi:hypothetical protein